MTDLTCDQLDAMLPEFFDGELPEATQEAAARHLATCDHCRVVVDDLGKVSALGREHGRLRLSDEARTRIKRALAAE